MRETFRKYAAIPIFMTVLLFVIDGAMWYIDREDGKYLLVFSIGYLAVGVLIVLLTKKNFKQSLINFATSYGFIQKKLLKDFAIPYALLDESGKLLWSNNTFQELTEIDDRYHKSIATLFSELTKEVLAKVAKEHHLYHSTDEVFYHLCIKRITLSDADSLPLDDLFKDKESIFALYVFDETQLQESLKENEEQKLVSVLVYIDNYEEALDSIEEVKRSLLIALVDRKVNKYFSTMDGIVKKIEKDKYFIVLKRKHLNELEEDRFSVMEDVKSVKIGNKMSITLSIGVGNSSKTYAQSYEYTRAAIDLALGRGGDQAVVKSGEKISYYGGKTQQVEKMTRVKARVKAQALREILAGREQVIVMGHKLSDVDALGAGVGIYHAAQVLGKKAYIVINEVSSSLRPIKERFNEENGYDSHMFITSEEARALADRNTIVVVVDTNKPSYTECPELLSIAKTIVVFDHHRQGAEVIENAVLSYIEPYASSTCEMISEVLQYFSEDIKLDEVEADALYAGILIDTDNFNTKTGVRTFEAAAYLKRSGADMMRVRKMLRNEMNEYKARAEAVRHAEVYRSDFAISVCPGEGIESPTIAGAQAANELLDINGVKASFVLTEYNNRIFISSRSIDEVNVQIIMEKLGGGGHINVAGCQLEGITLDEAITRLKETLDQMIEKGEI